jgi:sulfite reductase (NADPH) flavoprotein alpha-component
MYGGQKEMASGSPNELQKTVDIAGETIEGFKAYYIRVPFKGEPYELSYANVRYGAHNLLKVDVQNDKIVSLELYRDKTLGQKLIQNIYALHSGQYFGEIGKAIWCASSLAMAMFSFSGAWMFYRRMRNKRGGRSLRAKM